MAGPPEEMWHLGYCDEQELQTKEGGKDSDPARDKDSRAVVWEGSASFSSRRQSLCRSALSILCFPHDRRRKGTLAIFHMALIKHMTKAAH